MEPSTPRLCVCSTVAPCFVARLFARPTTTKVNTRDRFPVHIYRTKEKRNGIRPKQVWDEVLTDERWLIPPTTMIKVGEVPPDIVYQIQLPVIRYHIITGEKSSVRIRVATYLHVNEVFDRVYPGDRMYTTPKMIELVKDFARLVNIPKRGYINGLINEYMETISRIK